MPRHVFISHASADAQLATRICGGLESRGIPCWIAPRDVQPEGTYGTEILKGLRECDVFLIVLTAAAAESQQVEREAERASHYRKRIIPLAVGGADSGPRLEFYIAGRQRLPCPSTPDEQFLDTLANVVRGEPVAHRNTPADAAAPARRWLLPAAASVLLAAAVIGGYFIVTSGQFESGNAGSSTPPEARPAEPSPRSGGSEPTAGPSGKPSSEEPAASGIAARGPAPSGRRTSAPAPVADRDTENARLRSPSAGAVDPLKLPADTAAAANVNGVKVVFVNVPAGTVLMGCQAGDSECKDDENKPPRSHNIAAFQMSATEVTQALWEAVMGEGNNPSDFKGELLPVVNISWVDAQDFLEKLNDRRDGFAYRLPTEAEWEYAARAGESHLPDLAAVAWFGLVDGTARSPRPQRVGAKRPNRLGLYDMLGNAAEWCDDWYSPSYQRVVRGGAWDDPPRNVRLSARGGAVPTAKTYSIGLRIVRTRG